MHERELWYYEINVDGSNVEINDIKDNPQISI